MNEKMHDSFALGVLAFIVVMLVIWGTLEMWKWVF
jgi:hypothetical protein